MLDFIILMSFFAFYFYIIYSAIDFIDKNTKI